MTDMKEKAKKVFSAYYGEPQHDPTLNLTDAFREVINQLQQSPGVIMCYDFLELCEEIEKLCYWYFLMTDLDKLLEKHHNRPPSLWNVMRHQLGFSIDMCDEIVDAVEEWMPKEHDTNSYEWNKCVRMLRERLWEQPE